MNTEPENRRDRGPTSCSSPGPCGTSRSRSSPRPCNSDRACRCRPRRRGRRRLRRYRPMPRLSRRHIRGCRIEEHRDLPRGTAAPRRHSLAPSRPRAERWWRGLTATPGPRAADVRARSVSTSSHDGGGLGWYWAVLGALLVAVGAGGAFGLARRRAPRRQLDASPLHPSLPRARALRSCRAPLSPPAELPRELATKIRCGGL